MDDNELFNGSILSEILGNIFLFGELYESFASIAFAIYCFDN